jgi:hypothetical protein
MVFPARLFGFSCPAPKLVLAVLFAATSLHARIGDTPEQMSARMLQPDLGKNFFWPKDMDARERERERRDSPISAFSHLMPTSVEDWREQIFWKSALHRQLSNEDGWRVHVYHLRGRSVLELYRRVGSTLTDFEVNAVLARMRGNQTWRRVVKKDNVDTVLGYDFELGEGDEATLRARKQGDWLLIFHKRFDDYLVERKARWDANEAQRKAELAAEQEKLAPVSVEGF